MFMALVTDQQMVRMSHEELFGEQQQMFRVFFSQHTHSQISSFSVSFL